MVHILYFYLFYWVMVLFGITIGYHRCLSHRQVKLSSFLETIVIYLGVISSACSPLSWSGLHRMHHAYSDTNKDPHSPNYKKWHEVLFSLYRVKQIPRKFVLDLYKNPRVIFMHKYKWIILIATYVSLGLISTQLLLYTILLLPMSFISYGILNLFGHNERGPTNVLWINIFAPFEGNHYDHHNS